MRGWSFLGWRSAVFNSAICVSSPELSPNPPGEAENGSDCTWVGLSQPTFRPTSKGSNWAVWVWSDRPTPVGSDCLNMKTFVGRIVTVSDGAGWSVTVSNWGVAQSSRHRTVYHLAPLTIFSSFFQWISLSNTFLFSFPSFSFLYHFTSLFFYELWTPKLFLTC